MITNGKNVYPMTRQNLLCKKSFFHLVVDKAGKLLLPIDPWRYYYQNRIRHLHSFYLYQNQSKHFHSFCTCSYFEKLYRNRFKYRWIWSLWDRMITITEWTRCVHITWVICDLATQGQFDHNYSITSDHINNASTVFHFFASVPSVSIWFTFIIIFAKCLFRIPGFFTTPANFQNVFALVHSGGFQTGFARGSWNIWISVKIVTYTFSNFYIRVINCIGKTILDWPVFLFLLLRGTDLKI